MVKDSLWAYHTTYKTLIVMSLHKHIFGKASHLPVELEHKVILAMKRQNVDWIKALKMRPNELNMLDEFLLNS